MGSGYKIYIFPKALRKDRSVGNLPHADRVFSPKKSSFSVQHLLYTNTK